MAVSKGVPTCCLQCSSEFQTLHWTSWCMLLLSPSVPDLALRTGAPASNCTVTQSGYLVFKRRWCVSQLPLHSEGGPSQPWKTQTNMCNFGLFSLKTDTAHSGLAPLSLVCREETGRQWSYPELCHLSYRLISELR